MKKKLAIKGHSTRGKEVIELLKMMGGDNIYSHWNGDQENMRYFINGQGNIDNGCLMANRINCEDFTLEEFLEKYPYKVGDKVQVLKSGKVFTIGNIIWDEEVCDIYYYNMVDIEYYNAEELKLYKETDIVKPVTDKSERTREDVIFDSIIWHLRNSVNNGKQYLSGGDCEAYFRELVKKVKVNDMESCKGTEFEDIKKVAYLSINDKDYADEIEVNLGDDYEYKFEMNRLYILKKKPLYPKSYGECCDVIGYEPCEDEINCYKGGFIESFVRLLICRDAYWKMAGKQMGLGKSWKPDWNHINRNFYCIYNSKNNIVKNVIYSQNNILAFPTEEMRDAFYENFKDLIERCKELL